MAIHKMKTSSFPDAGYEQWKETAVHSLKGKPFESLLTKTVEGITLRPLYTLGELEARLQTVRPVSSTSGWIVAQQTIAEDGQRFLKTLEDSLARGNEAIVYDGRKQLSWNDRLLDELGDFIQKYPVFITDTSKDDPILKVFDRIPAEFRSSVKGAVSVRDWRIPQGYDQVRTLGADLWDVHHQGADAVTELALSLAKASELAASQETFDEFAEQFFVRFAVDTHFFMEIAKFRAFRVLWQGFSQAYGKENAPSVPLLAITSLRSYSKLDPNVNLLRAGNEAFSAVLGGADALTVHPHDVLTGVTDHSVRLARNIQLVIKEETYVTKVADPSGGSYFIETLTAELVERAWKQFLEIDAMGGYDAYLATGRIEQTMESRKKEVATGKKSLVGTNVYAELTPTNFSDSGLVAAAERLAAPFEQLRQRFEDSQPRAAVLTFGALKDFKPRADFVTGFLATGGIRAEWSPAFANAQEALNWLASEQPDYAVVCASPAETEQVMDELLAKRPVQVVLDAAGKVDAALSEKWRSAGLDGFVFAGQNKIEKLLEIAHKVEGGAHIE